MKTKCLIGSIGRANVGTDKIYSASSNQTGTSNLEAEHNTILLPVCLMPDYVGGWLTESQGFVDFLLVLLPAC